MLEWKEKQSLTRRSSSRIIRRGWIWSVSARRRSLRRSWSSRRWLACRFTSSCTIRRWTRCWSTPVAPRRQASSHLSKPSKCSLMRRTSWKFSRRWPTWIMRSSSSAPRTMIRTSRITILTYQKLIRSLSSLPRSLFTLRVIKSFKRIEVLELSKDSNSTSRLT